MEKNSDLDKNTPEWLVREEIAKVYNSLSKPQIPLNQNADWGKLVRWISSENVYLVEGCFRSLHKLVAEKKISAEEAVWTIISCAPSLNENSVENAVYTIHKLIIQLKGHSWHTDPWLALIKSRKNFFITIVTLIEHSLTHGDDEERLRAFNMFREVIFHSLTSTSLDTLLNKTLLHATLCRVIRTTTAPSSTRQEIEKLLCNALPHHSIASSSSLSFLVSSTTELVDSTIRNKTQITNIEKNNLDMIQIELIDLIAKIKNFSSTSPNQFKDTPGSVLALLRVCTLTAQMSIDALFTREHLLFFAVLLLQCTQEEQREILAILKTMVYHLQTKKSIDRSVKFSLIFLVFPLVEIISYNSDHKPVASHLLELIELSISSSSSNTSSTTPCPSSLSSSSSSSAKGPKGMHAYLSNALDFLEELLLSSSDNNLCIEWMETIRTELKSKESVTPLLLCLLSSFLFHQDQQVKLSALKIVERIGEVNAMQGIRMLPLLLYQLRNESDAEMQIKIIYTIPSLAKSFACLTPVLRCVRMLSHDEALYLRVLCRIWQKQERIFPQLEAIISQYSNSQKFPVKLSIASCIHDIATKKPHKAVDFINVVSQLMSEKNASIVAVALRTLTIFCNEDILDFKVSWKIIEKNVGNSSDPLIESHIASFLSSGVSLSNEDEEEDDEDSLAEKKSVVTAAVQKLWDLVQHSTSNSVKAEGISVDIIELNSDDFKALKTIGIYAAANPDNLSEISVESIVELLRSEDSDIRRHTEVIITTLLTHELSQRRGKSEEGNTNAAIDLLSQLPNYLLQKYESTPSAALRSGLAGSLLWAFQPPAPPHSVTKLSAIPRRFLVSKGRAYRRILNDVINDITLDDWFSRLVCANGWIKFMKECLVACVEAQMAESSMNNEPLEHRKAIEITFDSLLKDLLAKSKTTPKCSENCCLAMSALCLQLPNSLYSRVEQVLNILKEFLAKGDNEWIEFGSALGLAILSTCLNPTDNDSLQEIVTALTHKLRNSENEWVRGACGIALGIVASSLFRRNQSTTQVQNNFAIFESIQTLLSQLAFPTSGVKDGVEDWSRLGAALGIAYSAAALEISGNNQERLKKMYLKFSDVLKSNVLPRKGAKISAGLMGILLAIPAITSRCYRLNIIQSSDVAKLLEEFKKKFKNIDEDDPSNMSLYISYWSVMHLVLAEGFATDPKELQSHINDMIDTTIKSEVTWKRTAAVISLANFMGSLLAIPIIHNSLMYSASYLSPVIINDPAWLPVLSKTISTIKSIIDTDKSINPSLFRNSVWALGSLTRALQPVEGSDVIDAVQATVAPSPSDLPKSSIVRILYDTLQRCMTETPVHSSQVESVMTIFSNSKNKLPRSQWKQLVLNVMKAEISPSAHKQCITFVVNNTAADSALLSLVLEWTSDVTFPTLSPPLQLQLVALIPSIVLLFATGTIFSLMSNSSHQPLELVLLSREATKVIQKLVPNVFILQKEWEWKRTVLRALSELLKKEDLHVNLLQAGEETLQALFEHLPSPFNSSSTLHTLHADAVEVLDEYVACLCALRKRGLCGPFVTSLLHLEGNISRALKAIYIITKLIPEQILESNALSLCRSWCLSQSLENSVEYSLSLLSLFVTPLSLLSNDEKSKFLMDTLDVIPMCSNVGQFVGVHALAVVCIAANSKSDAAVLFSKQLNFQRKVAINNPEALLDIPPAVILSNVLLELLDISHFSALTERIIQKLTALADNSKLHETLRALFQSILLRLRRSIVS